MIKNLLLFCTVLLVIFSCGKQGDPFYKDPEKKTEIQSPLINKA